jgi:hypothetical protein
MPRVHRGAGVTGAQHRHQHNEPQQHQSRFETTSCEVMQPVTESVDRFK